MRSLLVRLTFAQRQLREIERELERLSVTQPAVALLRAISGIRPRTAEAIVAFTRRVDPFANRKRYASYPGMTRTEDSSGRVQRHGHISKRGPSVVRWVLTEALQPGAAELPGHPGLLRTTHSRPSGSAQEGDHRCRPQIADRLLRNAARRHAVQPTAVCRPGGVIEGLLPLRRAPRGMVAGGYKDVGETHTNGSRLTRCKRQSLGVGAGLSEVVFREWAYHARISCAVR